MGSRMRVLIFGVSYHGRAIYRLLDRSLYDIVGFLENDIDKRVGKFGDAKIYHIKNINTIDFDKIVISGRNIDSMVRQLTNDFFINQEKIKIMGRSDLVLNGSALDKKERILCDMLFNFINLCGNKDIKYWMCYSSLLALKRKEEFAKFSDVDICIMSEQIPLLIDTLNTDFASYNIVINKYHNHSKYWKIKDASSITISERVDTVISEPASIDILALNKCDDKVFIQAPFDKVHVLPFHYFDGNSVIDYCNLSFSVPRDAKECLRLIYGNNWMVPTERWQHKDYRSVDW